MRHADRKFNFIKTETDGSSISIIHVWESNFVKACFSNENVCAMFWLSSLLSLSMTFYLKNGWYIQKNAAVVVGCCQFILYVSIGSNGEVQFVLFVSTFLTIEGLAGCRWE
jgi:hypothetical protein